ncbi:hypothetical protein Tco_0871002 [Tanacetum coccineum]
MKYHPQTHILLRSIMEVLQIGIRANVIENQLPTRRYPGGLSDIGSSGVDGPPVMPEDPYAYVVAAFQAPPSPDYVPDPEEPEQAPPLPEFVPEPPLPAAVSPTANSPGYIPESDPEEDPEEDDDEDPEEDPADYPTNRDDDDEEEEEEDPSEDEANDEEEDEDDEEEEDPSEDEANDEEEDEDDEEEEEHPAPVDSIPSPVHRITARISHFFQIQRLPDYLLYIPLPPLLISPPLPVSPPPLPVSPTYPLGYRSAMIWMRAKIPSTSHPLPLPPPVVLPYTRASLAMMRAAAPSTYILAPRSGILPLETPPSGTPPL